MIDVKVVFTISHKKQCNFTPKELAELFGLINTACSSMEHLVDVTYKMTGDKREEIDDPVIDFLDGKS